METSGKKKDFHLRLVLFLHCLEHLKGPRDSAGSRAPFNPCLLANLVGGNVYSFRGDPKKHAEMRGESAAGESDGWHEEVTTITRDVSQLASADEQKVDARMLRKSAMQISSDYSDEESDWHDGDSTTDDEESFWEETESESAMSTESDTSSDGVSPLPVKLRLRRRIESDSEDEPLVSSKKRGSKSVMESWDSEDEPLSKRKKEKLAQPLERGNAEMYSGSNRESGSEKCAICLLKLGGGGQEVGQPDGGCPHEFCLICIKEWSKNVATCPIDRSEFRNIIVKLSPKGKEVKREAVVKVTPVKEEEEELPNPGDFVVCETCWSGDREERLLLCDGCDMAHHLECLTPPLTRMPRGLWYCDICERAGLVSSMNRRRVGAPRIRSDDEKQADDLDGFIVPDDEESFMFREEEVGIAGLVLPRTFQNVRLRRLVRTRRSEVAEIHPRPAVSSSSGATRRRKTKKKTSRKSKTTRKRKPTSSPTKKRKNKQKSTTKKQRTMTKRRKGKAAKKESKKKMVSSKSEKNNSFAPEDSSRILLFRNPDELDYFGDDDNASEEPRPSTSGFGSTLGNPPPVASRSKAVSINKLGSPSKRLPW